MSNLKVEGKVTDFCPKCKNCKSTTRECDGKKDWLTEVECEDPYDGMKKILAADSDICCSMFEPKPDRRCEKCERFDGTYCHGPNGTITISYKALFGEPVNCPLYSEKKARESEESRIEEIREGLMKITKAFTNEELIKASKRKDELIQYYREKLKKVNDEINLLNSKFDKLGEYYRTNEKLIDNIQKVIFPQEEGSDYTYSYEEILNKVKDLKVQSKYEKLLNDILEIVYEHPEMFERNMTAYELLPGRVKLLKNSWDMMCDKYDPLNVENEQRKKAMNNQAKMIQDLKKERDELYQVNLNKSQDIINLEKEVKHFKECKSCSNIVEENIKLEVEIDKIKNENISLNTINKGISEDRKKLINYICSLKIASENYLKEFTYKEESNNE